MNGNKDFSKCVCIYVLNYRCEFTHNHDIRSGVFYITM